MHLSQRQREILLLISEGRSNKEIAQMLDMSPKTVDSHLQRLYLRHGVNSRAALVAKWLKAEFAAQTGRSTGQRPDPDGKADGAGQP